LDSTDEEAGEVAVDDLRELRASLGVSRRQPTPDHVLSSQSELDTKSESSAADDVGPTDEVEVEIEKNVLDTNVRMLQQAGYVTTHSVDVVDPEDRWLQRYVEDSCGPPKEVPPYRELKDLTDTGDVIGRKAVLSEEIHQWREAFASHNGRQPTKREISKDPTVAALDRELKDLSEAEDPQRPTAVPKDLWRRWAAHHAMSVDEWHFFHTLASYVDVLDVTSESRMELILLHVLSHVAKATALVSRHDQIVKHQPDETPFRDQGFATARVVIFLPMRNAAFQYVTALAHIAGIDTNTVRRWADFERDYGATFVIHNRHIEKKTAAYRRVFDGNVSDVFCFGMSLRGLKLGIFIPLMKSDIIVASPLGLRCRLRKDMSTSSAVSSIEVCVVDQCDVLLMQNWEHVKRSLRCLNCRPHHSTSELANFTRIFHWMLDGAGRAHRQTILLSSLHDARIVSLQRTFVNNIGKVQNIPRDLHGVLDCVSKDVRQHFLRVEVTSNKTEKQERFHYFSNVFYPKRIAPVVHTNVPILLYIPCYLDFVLVRNFLQEEAPHSFEEWCEYTSERDQKRALHNFSARDRPLFLLTERCYFYSRVAVRGPEMVFFYAPPLFPSFYYETINAMDSTPNSSVVVLYTAYDVQQLCRIAGSQRTRQLLHRNASVFTFVTTP